MYVWMSMSGCGAYLDNKLLFTTVCHPHYHAPFLFAFGNNKITNNINHQFVIVPVATINPLDKLSSSSSATVNEIYKKHNTTQ